MLLTSTSSSLINIGTNYSTVHLINEDEEMATSKSRNNATEPVLGFIKPRRILLVVALLIIGGAVFYHHVEGLSWLDSVYFCVITLTTVGYGDITPHTDAGKIFTIFYILFGVAIIASSLSYLLKSSVMKRVTGRHEDEQHKP